jgi:hypothetical protein
MVMLSSIRTNLAEQVIAEACGGMAAGLKLKTKCLVNSGRR